MPTLMNGAFHWVPSEKQNKDTFQNLVAAFDMGNEVLREIMVPNDLVKIDVLQLSISVLGTSLALIQYEKILLSDHCWAWVMKDYGMTESWGRLYTIDMREEILRVVRFKKNNEVLCASATRGTGLLSYDPNSREIKNLGIHGLNDRLSGNMHFGFDSLSNDYKVVRIVYQNSVSDGYNCRVPPDVEKEYEGFWGLRKILFCKEDDAYIVSDLLEEISESRSPLISNMHAGIVLGTSECFLSKNANFVGFSVEVGRDSKLTTIGSLILGCKNQYL
ncbi:hypothetical protein Vadar_012305 [Vaccinium darrowii]|uniref:Uncharacterized protein n=1 Tax=Vaccinium darrowii TaxID=229202 RepID=A0ACB7Z369_9ERIC|nr:hypothetical protein Vadar_012305 [Vaccinium darrowii]